MPDGGVWRVVDPPPALRAFAGPHTLYLSHVAQVTAAGRARRCVLVVTCQMLFLCDGDGAVRRAAHVLADLADLTLSSRPRDVPPAAARDAASLAGDARMLRVRVRGEHDLLLCVPDPPHGGKRAADVLRAVYGELTGHFDELPVVAPPTGGTLLDDCDLREHGAAVRAASGHPACPFNSTDRPTLTPPPCGLPPPAAGGRRPRPRAW
eukprot:gene42178-54497_t